MMTSGSFAGTGVLARLVIRRDRVRLPIWIATVTVLVASTVSSFRSLYPTAAVRSRFGVSVTHGPALLGLDGPIFNAASLGGLTGWRIGGSAAVVAALMSVLTIVRHTRAEEEAGRVELVGAGVVGRYAPLSAALSVVALADVAIGVLVAAAMAGFGTGLAGSVALGAGIASGGLMFAAVAALAAQLPDGGRTANGIALSTLGAAFLVRAVGDATSGGTGTWLSWLSPIGWTQQVRPYADERWWVFALVVAFTGGLVATAYALVDRRDVGAGLLPDRLGPPAGAPGLSGPLALAWRQHRGALLGWSVAFVVVGVALGGSAKGIASLLGTSAQLQDMISRIGGQSGMTDAFLAATMSICGLIASAYAVAAVSRLRSEETALRVEPLLATPVGRYRFAASHLILAVAGTVVLMLVAGLATGLTYGVAIGDVGGQVGRMVGAALVEVPAACVLAGVAVALFGLLPRFTTLAWGVLAAFVLLGQVGPLLRLGQGVMDVSPFTHVPKLPGGPFSVLPLVVLLLVAAALMAAGLAGFRRRDVG